MKENLKKLNEFEWELDKTVRKEMRVKAKIIANDKIMNAIENEAITQLTNVTCLPGIIEPAIGLPDMHWGYGLPMGAVGAFDAEEGIISAGLCGFDINCGINLIRTNLTLKEVLEKQKELVAALFDKIPCGVGSKGKLRLTKEELNEVLLNGVNWAYDKGYATKKDIQATEENGCMKGADPSKVSDLAKKRGCPQLGTLGAGNHFLEIQKVTDVFDKKGKEWGVTDKDQILIMLHCGSRGLGHQVASDYLKIQEKAVKKYNIWLPDNQLVCAPVNSKEGQDFFAAMKAAVNYSFTNRAVITKWIREVFEKVFKKDWEKLEMENVYSIAHNIVKLEEHIVNGKKKKLYVHRKGATRAFPDMPVIIAGSMGTSSYLLVGTKKAEEISFGSTTHGAGRVMSRGAAWKKFTVESVNKELKEKDILHESSSKSGIVPEAPAVYKDIEEVVKVSHDLGLSRKVAKLRPLAVING